MQVGSLDVVEFWLTLPLLECIKIVKVLATTLSFIHVPREQSLDGVSWKISEIPLRYPRDKLAQIPIFQLQCLKRKLFQKRKRFQGYLNLISPHEDTVCFHTCHGTFFFLTSKKYETGEYGLHGYNCRK